MRVNPRRLIAAAIVAVVAHSWLASAVLAAEPAADPLPSWNEGAAKQAILSFVKDATDKSSSRFIEPEDRIATFDNDGTLWCEQPVVELAFTLGRLKEMAAADPSLKEKQPFTAALTGDHDYFKKAGMKAILELVIATHGNTSQDDFEKAAGEFFKTAKHPKYNVPFPQTAYAPMVELLVHLRANGFETWICSGGWMDLMRMMSWDSYGISSQQVIGSSLKEEWIEKNGEYTLWLLPEMLDLCDHAGKPVEIDLHIGKRPALAGGNVRTGGDIEMLRYCQGRKGATLQLVINHDDSEREFAYGEENDASLTAAKEFGWTVVSIKNDWKTVFAFEEK